MSSHASDDAAGATWSRRYEDVEPCWRWCYRVMLAMILPGGLCHGAMKMSSHANDNAAESC
jgi:hypothetical protein